MSCGVDPRLRAAYDRAVKRRADLIVRRYTVGLTEAEDAEDHALRPEIRRLAKLIDPKADIERGQP